MEKDNVLVNRVQFYMKYEVVTWLVKKYGSQGDAGIGFNQGDEFSYDIIDQPFHTAIKCEDGNTSTFLYIRNDFGLYSEDTANLSITFHANNDKPTVKNRGGFAGDTAVIILLFYKAGAQLRDHILRNNLMYKFSDLDLETEGILVKLANDALSFERVSGSKRPTMACAVFGGAVQMKRPYQDEITKSMMYDEMPFEENLEAAENGDIDAMGRVAAAYFTGDGDADIKPDMKKAAYWFKKQAESDDPTGQFNLAIMYLKGEGVKQSFKQALYWMRKAEKNGNDDAAAHVELYSKIIDLQSKADNGDAKAMAELADEFMNLGLSLGTPYEKELFDKCLALAKKAESANIPEVMWVLALAYEHGRGVKPDKKKAIGYYQKGADLGHSGCQNNLGIDYIQGKGVPENKAKGFSLCLKSAEQGYAPAMKTVGTCYQFGHGVDDSMEKAIYWYEKYLEIADDPELAQKVKLFKRLPDSEKDKNSARELTEGYTDALEHFIAADGKDEERLMNDWFKLHGKDLSKGKITIKGQTFVFTGVDKLPEWPNILKKLTAMGGIERSAVSGKTNYLVCNPQYAGEAKIQRAIEQRSKGNNVKIVLLDDFLKAINMSAKPAEIKSIKPETVAKNESAEKNFKSPASRKVKSHKSENKIIFTYNDQLKANGDGYTIDIPDGFIIKNGTEGRDFIAYLPNESSHEDYLLSDFLIFAGQKFENEIIAQFRTVAEFTAVGKGIGVIFDEEKTVHYDRKDLPGTILYGFDSNCLHANILVGIDDHMQAMRVQISNVTRQSLAEYEQAVVKLLDHMVAYQPVKLLKELDADEYIYMYGNTIAEWADLIDEYKNHIINARNFEQSSLVEFFKSNGSGNLSKLKKDIKNMLKSISGYVDEQLVKADAIYTLKRAEHPKSTALKKAKTALNALIDLAYQEVNLNGEHIYVKSKFADAAKARIEKNEVSAIWDIIDSSAALNKDLKDALIKAKDARIKATEENARLREQAEKRRTEEEYCRKNAIYDSAAKDMAANTIKSYENAIEKYETIRSWRDADQKIIECQNCIAEIKRKEETDRIAAEKAAKKKKKITLIALSAAVAAIAIFLVVTKIIIPNNKYNAAIELIESGEYEEAITAFEALDGYKDSVDKFHECSYEIAVDLKSADKYEEAILAFKASGGYKDSTKQIEKCKQGILTNANVGDYVYFGSYEQDNNIYNGTEDIEWLVLDKQDNKILVISKYGLDAKPYNKEYTRITWEKCTLRSWLNSDFYNAAFSADEKKAIVQTEVSADKNPEYNTNPGNGTTDNVFLLSKNEVNKYFSSDSARQCVPTDYAIAQEAYANSNYKIDGKAACWWCLWSPVDYQDYAVYVDRDGSVRRYGPGVLYVNYCVRPALWINLYS